MNKSLQNKRWLVAVSSGPDSMALLDMCIKEKLNIGVCHVNYHKRKQSNAEMKYVESFCKEHKVPCYILDKKYEYEGNFQSFARDWRYSFFREIANKYKYDGVLIAHQKDDVIETYLMQKKRNTTPEVYGIKKTGMVNGIYVCRPLLNKTKQDLVNYCEENNVKYYIDESNNSDDYTRNKIRHTMIDKMSLKDKNKLIKEINEKNKRISDLKKELKKLISVNKIEYTNYINCKNKEELLRMFLKNNQVAEYNKSKLYFSDLQKKLKKNSYIILKNKSIIEDDGYIQIIDNVEPYTYTIDGLKYFKTSHFKTCKKGPSTCAVTVKADDFPLTIRSFLEGDKIKMRFGSKSVHRFFIDRKIPLYQRKAYPVVVNSKNEVILVPFLGCNVTHYTIKPNLFVIK